MIKSQVECEKALRALGKSFTNLNVTEDNKFPWVPAGCYWKLGRIGEGGKGFFNNIVDPTLTDPNSFGFRGGVCMGMGKNC